jgi:hypothetical protein
MGEVIGHGRFIMHEYTEEELNNGPNGDLLKFPPENGQWHVWIIDSSGEGSVVPAEEAKYLQPPAQNAANEKSNKGDK